MNSDTSAQNDEKINSSITKIDDSIVVMSDIIDDFCTMKKEYVIAFYEFKEQLFLCQIFHQMEKKDPQKFSKQKQLLDKIMNYVLIFSCNKFNDEDYIDQKIKDTILEEKMVTTKEQLRNIKIEDTDREYAGDNVKYIIFLLQSINQINEFDTNKLDEIIKDINLKFSDKKIDKQYVALINNILCLFKK